EVKPCPPLPSPEYKSCPGPNGHPAPHRDREARARESSGTAPPFGREPAQQKSWELRKDARSRTTPGAPLGTLWNRTPPPALGRRRSTARHLSPCSPPRSRPTESRSG